MRQKRVFALVSMDELEADVAVQAVAIAARWVYFHPPRIVFEPKNRPAEKDEGWRTCHRPFYLPK